MPASCATEQPVAPLPARAARALIGWYRSHGRALPWRSSDDPWRVLVSEFMLQQTRVETVVPRYAVFLARFPDPASMAAASEEEVLAAWSGLGYYRRARNLHRLARIVVDEHGGALPAEQQSLRSLPGVGDYTAAAVGSIAFGSRRLTIDGNVERVLSRHLGAEGNPKRAAARRAMKTLMAAALERWPPGDVNQALMELGATICLPRTPSCHTCPLQSTCVAFRDGSQLRIPPSRAQVVHDVEEAAAVIENEGRYLLFRGQRPGSLADMWEFPTLDSRLHDGDRALPDELVAFLAERGVRATIGDRLGTIRHGITDRRIRCAVFRCVGAPTAELPPQGPVPLPIVAAPEAAAVARRWARREQIERLPIGATVGKILRLLDA